MSGLPLSACRIACVCRDPKRYMTITRRLKCYVRTQSSVPYSQKYSTDSPSSGKLDLQIPEPEFNWRYLCNPKNTADIRNAIKYRKGVGDIDSLVTAVKMFKNVHSIDLLNDKDLTRLDEAHMGKDCRKAWDEILQLAAAIPNKTHPSSPRGEGRDTDNVVVDYGGALPDFDFPPRSIVELGRLLDGLRTDNVGHTSGQKSYYFMGDLARLEQALIRYTVDRLRQNGFTLISVPDMLSPTIIEGCGFKTDGEHTQVYRLLPSSHGDVCLSGTGEMGLAGFFMNSQFEHEELPKRVMTVSRCYRAEASDSQQEMGIYRVHQFTKVEMFSLVANEEGGEADAMMENFLTIQKNMFEDLGLHFRILDMAAHELGAPAYRKYDIEAWIPGNKIWGEISSTSNCTDYQSRRLNMKYQSGTSGKMKPVYTLNGTACAVPRMIMAILETMQREDGSVGIPRVLQPYMNGQEVMDVCETPIKMKWIRLTKNYKKQVKGS